MRTDIGTGVALVAPGTQKTQAVPTRAACRSFGHRRVTLPAAPARSEGSTRAPQQPRQPLMTGRPANYRGSKPSTQTKLNSEVSPREPGGRLGGRSHPRGAAEAPCPPPLPMAQGGCRALGGGREGSDDAEPPATGEMPCWETWEQGRGGQGWSWRLLAALSLALGPVGSLGGSRSLCLQGVPLLYGSLGTGPGQKSRAGNTAAGARTG